MSVPHHVWIITHVKEANSTIACACRTREDVIRELHAIVAERRELVEREIIEPQPELTVENVKSFGHFNIDDSTYEIDCVQVLKSSNHPR